MANSFPAEYERLRWIKGSGSNYTTTGIVPSTDLEIEIDTVFRKTYSHNILFATSSNDTNVYFNAKYTNEFIFGISSTSEFVSVPLTGHRDVERIFKCTINGENASLKVYDVNRELLEENTTQYTGSLTTSPIKIFNTWGGWTGETYSVKIRSGSSSFNYIPALCKSDNKPGFLDIATMTFLTANTGEFGYEKMDGTIVNPI